MVEIHDEDHGLYLLRGHGIYGLDGLSLPVEGDDFITWRRTALSISRPRPRPRPSLSTCCSSQRTGSPGSWRAASRPANDACWDREPRLAVAGSRHLYRALHIPTVVKQRVVLLKVQSGRRPAVTPGPTSESRLRPPGHPEGPSCHEHAESPRKRRARKAGVTCELLPGPRVGRVAMLSAVPARCPRRLGDLPDPPCCVSSQARITSTRTTSFTGGSTVFAAGAGSSGSAPRSSTTAAAAGEVGGRPTYVAARHTS